MFIHISFGGPEYDIQVDGKRFHFEMHPYCGPVAINKRGEELKRQPLNFLAAVSLWDQQGRRVEDGLCRWDREPIPILKHLGGKNYLITGYHQPVRGN